MEGPECRPVPPQSGVPGAGDTISIYTPSSPTPAFSLGLSILCQILAPGGGVWGAAVHLLPLLLWEKCWQSRGSALCAPGTLFQPLGVGGLLGPLVPHPLSDSWGPGLWAQLPGGLVAVMKEPRSPSDRAANIQAKKPGTRGSALPGENWSAGSGLAWRQQQEGQPG